MTDRLRRLDALFAERVLGCKVVWDASIVDRLAGLNPPADPCCSCGDHRYFPAVNLRPYTRSLDAAWEGACKLKPEYGGIRFHECPFGDACAGWFASFDASDDLQSEEEWDGHASHPAEALVLACLRAVGCTEEELA